MMYGASLYLHTGNQPFRLLWNLSLRLHLVLSDPCDEFRLLKINKFAVRLPIRDSLFMGQLVELLFFIPIKAAASSKVSTSLALSRRCSTASILFFVRQRLSWFRCRVVSLKTILSYLITLLVNICHLCYIMLLSWVALVIPCAFVVKSVAKLRLVLSNIRIFPFCQAQIQQYLTFEYDFLAKIRLKRSLFCVFGIISRNMLW